MPSIIPLFLMAIAMTVLATKQVTGCPVPPGDRTQMDAGYGNIPLIFIPNQGQMDERVHFAVNGRDKSIYFTPQGLTYVLTEAPAQKDEDRLRTSRSLRSIEPAEMMADEARRRWVVKLDFVGARKDVRPESLVESETVISYFKGKPEDWQAGIKASSRIIYRDLWPGIDLVYYGTVNKMKYEFLVQPGADPKQIKLAYRGVEGLSLTPEGRLEVSTPLIDFQDDTPLAWQDGDNGRTAVSVAYALREANVQVAGLNAITSDSHFLPGVSPHDHSHVYGFTLGEYDRSNTLILDPAVFIYCGYIGGSGDDRARCIAVDSNGYAYVAGETYSTEATFPVTVGPALIYNAGSADAFVAKINSDGTALIYCGYIGGSGFDKANGIAVDSYGNAYVAGETSSTQASFPVTVGPDVTHNGSSDAFVAKVNSDGTALIYCGYIGGSGSDKARGIAVDSAGNAYVSGQTNSTQTTFPETGGPDLTHNGVYDAFVAKVSADGTALSYCGYLGGSGNDYAESITVDSAGNAFVAGWTKSTEAAGFPVLIGPDLTHNGGDYDAFVAKVSADGTALSYCGYIGGSGDDFAIGIAVDSTGNAYVAGNTQSTEATFPVTVGPDLTHNGGRDAFVAKVSTDGTALSYCGYIGGSGSDYADSIAVDSAGSAYLAGNTSSAESSFPVLGGPDLAYNGGSFDAFVAKVSADGTALVYCGYIGGSLYDYGSGIALDSYGNAYVAGFAGSAHDSFPVLGGPDLTHNGDYDAFVAKISSVNAPAVTSVVPGSGIRGKTLAAVTIAGTYFTGASAVSFGAGITVDDFEVVSASEITADITIAGDAAIGARDVSVTTPVDTGTLTGAFTVRTRSLPGILMLLLGE